ncbi:MAG: HD domain-containing protein [Pirellula sp.]|nr:HD domain-containing protein [Pirellula sp.]
MNSVNPEGIEPRRDLVQKIEAWDGRWGRLVLERLRVQMADADPAHGLEHVQRVVRNACLIATNLVNSPGLGGARRVDFEVLLPAAWFHDCVYVPKNSAQRSEASRLAADRAVVLLTDLGYPAVKFPAIAHAIEAHSFSAQIPCRSLEAQVLQDADRLEALGAIGLARCLMTGGSMGQRLYHPEDPFPTVREPRDDQQSVDHFFAKLLKLPSTMQTESGKQIASERAGYLAAFLEQLAQEIGVPIQLPSEFRGLQSGSVG